MWTRRQRQMCIRDSVRCFTKSGSWNNWLDVKERLAIAIKEIVEKNGASFAFPSQSIYVEKK